MYTMNKSVRMSSILMAIVMVVAVLIVIQPATDEVFGAEEGFSPSIDDYVGSYYYDNGTSYVRGLEIRPAQDTDGVNDEYSHVLETYPVSGTKMIMGIEATGEMIQIPAQDNVVLDYMQFELSENGQTIRFNKEISQTGGFLHTAWDYITTDDSTTNYQEFYRADDQANISVSPGLGFNPYYLDDAVRLARTVDNYDRVTIYLNDGEYDLRSDFRVQNGTLRIIAEAGADSVVINDMEFNGSGNGSSLVLQGLKFTDEIDSGDDRIGYFSNFTVQSCIFENTILRLGYAQHSNPGVAADLGTTSFLNNTMTMSGDGEDSLHCATISNQNIIIENNTVSGYNRGFNVQCVGGGSVEVVGNTISNLKYEGTDGRAVQIADNIDGMDILISDNTFTNCDIGVSIHDGLTGNPDSFVITGNVMTDVDTGILYKSNASGDIVEILVDASLNYYRGSGSLYSAENGDDVSEFVNCSASYTDSEKTTVNTDSGFDPSLVVSGSSTLYSETDSVVATAKTPNDPSANYTIAAVLSTGRISASGLLSEAPVFAYITAVDTPLSVDANVVYDIGISGLSSVKSYDVILNFTVPEGQTAISVIVTWYSDDWSQSEQIEITDFDDGSVRFTTSHNSYYAVSVETETVSNDDTSCFDSGSGIENDPFTITSVDSLKAFRDAVNAGNSFEGVYIQLEYGFYDISDEVWTPIGITVVDDDGGQTDYPFKGYFDGNYSVISGLNLEGEDLQSYRGMDSGDYFAYGFFGGIVGGSVEDLIFEDYSVSCPGPNVQNNVTAVAVGSVMYNGRVSGITVGEGEITGISRVAGVVGYIGGPKVDAAGYDGTMTMGIISITGCVNRADVQSSWTTSTHGTAAGILATTNQKDVRGGVYYIQDNVNHGNITGYWSAGIVASDFSTLTVEFILNNTNYGTISSLTAGITNVNETSSMGIYCSHGDGADHAAITISGNINNGDVTSQGRANGIAGTLYTNSVVSGNTNNGAITGGQHVSGIVSVVYGGEVEDNVNNGDVIYNGTYDHYSNEASAGGIVAFAQNVTIDGSSNTNNGMVAGTDGSVFIGGILGTMPYGTIANIDDSLDIGVIKGIGNNSFTVTLSNVVVEYLAVLESHNQSFTYTVVLDDGSSVGILFVLSNPNSSGMNLEIMGGRIDSAMMEFNANSNLYLSRTSIDELHSIVGGYHHLTVATDSQSSIGTMHVGSSEVPTSLFIGFTHVGNPNSDDRVFLNEGDIGTVIVYGTQSEATRYVNNPEMPELMIYAGDDHEVIDDFSNGQNVSDFDAISAESIATGGILDKEIETNTVFVPAGFTLTVSVSQSSTFIGQESTSSLVINEGATVGSLQPGSYTWVNEHWVSGAHNVTFVVDSGTISTVQVADGGVIDPSQIPIADYGYHYVWTYGDSEWDPNIQVTDNMEIKGEIALDTPVVSITGPDSMYVGSTASLEATVTDMVPNLKYSYTWTNAVGTGTDNSATVISTVAGVLTVSVTVTVSDENDLMATSESVSLNITVSEVPFGFVTDTMTVYDGFGPIELVVECPADASVSYVCSDPDVIYVSSGVMRSFGDIQSVKTVTITATMTYLDVVYSDQMTVTVLPNDDKGDERNIVVTTGDDSIVENIDQITLDSLPSGFGEAFTVLDISYVDGNGQPATGSATFVVSYDKIIPGLDPSRYIFVVVHVGDPHSDVVDDVVRTDSGLWITWNDFSPFVFFYAEIPEDSGEDVPVGPFPDDDDEYVPIPPVVYEDSGDDDTVTIVACVAAAVVAAILAVFLIIEYRKR